MEIAAASTTGVIKKGANKDDDAIITDKLKRVQAQKKGLKIKLLIKIIMQQQKVNQRKKSH